MTAPRLLGLLLPLTLCLAAPAAEAKTYCVNYAACPAGGLTSPTVKDAVTAANTNADADVVRVGPGTYSEQAFSATTAVEIAGAGMGQTTLVPVAGSSTAVQLSNGNSSASDLTIRLTYNNVQAGLRFQNGADASRVEIVSTDDTFANISGFVAEDPGTTLDAVRTDLGPTPTGSAAYFFEGGTVTDSTFVGGIGVSPDDTTILRTTVRASIGLRAFGTEGTIARNVVVTPHPRNPGAFSAGVEVTSGNQNQKASLTASHLTVVGPGSSGAGLRARANSSATQGTAALTASDTIVRGTSVSLGRAGRQDPQKADLTVSYSSYDGSAIENSGNGTLGTTTGNVTSNADPRFVDPANADFRLRHDSPLLDQGNPSSVSTDAAGDRLARTRVRDGNGNGTAVRDPGAYEYQRLAPVAAFTFSPQSPLTGTSVAFTNATVDPDGDPLTYAWSFGDGGADSAVNTAHTYASAGTRSASLTATDATGLTGTAAQPVPVTDPPAGVPPVDTSSTQGGAPVLSRVSLLRSRFAVVRRGGKVSARKRKPVKRGTYVRYTLSAPAKVSIVIERAAAGRVRGKGAARKCVAPSRKTRNAKPCTRYVKVGTVTASGKAGRQSTALTGRLARKTLKPGRYRARVVATDGPGRRSKESRVSFTVIRG